MHRWYTLAFTAGIVVATACGGSDRHSETAADSQGTATGGAGPSGAMGVPPEGATPPSTPNSEPSNVPPESSLPPNRANPSAQIGAGSLLASPAVTLGNGGSWTGSGGRTQSGGSSVGGRL